MSERSDQSLLDAIAAGDAGAFADFYDRHASFVTRLAWRFTGSESDAADVTQEAFAYVLRNAGRITLRAKVSTLLYPAVRNLAIAQRRKRKGMMSLGEDDLWPAAPAAATDGGREDVAALIARLPGHQREVVLLRFVDDLSLEEIAAALSIPVGTVKSRLHLGLAALRADEDVARRAKE